MRNLTIVCLIAVACCSCDPPIPSGGYGCAQQDERCPQEGNFTCNPCLKVQLAGGIIGGLCLTADDNRLSENICAGQCFDWQTDANNCGGCGMACSQGEACISGKCDPRGCASPLVACGSNCVNLKTDTDHCGACGTKCPGGATCLLGVCQCPTGEKVCSGVCADLQSDPRHCGACGYACASGQNCIAGECSAPGTDGGVADALSIDADKPTVPDLCSAAPDLTPVPTCTDGIKNGAETDVDCGPGCPACPNGKSCQQDSDCAVGMCGVGNICGLVGSFAVNSGPDQSTHPPVYTCLQACAAKLGGSDQGYHCSTQQGMVDMKSWLMGNGDNQTYCDSGNSASEDYSLGNVQFGGDYVGCNTAGCVFSAWVADQPPCTKTNYCFKR